MAEHAAIAAGLLVDSFAIFKDYSQPLEAGQVAILNPGDPVKIVRHEGEENVIVVKVDDDGNEVMGEDGKTPISDNLFPDEIEPAEMDEDDTTPAPVEGASDAPTTDAEFDEATPEELAAQTTRPKADEPAEAAPAEKPKTTRKPRAKKTEEAPAEAAPAPAAEKPKGRVRAKAAEAPAEAPAAEEKPKTEVKATPVLEIKDMLSVTEAVSAEGGDALRAAKALVERGEQTDFTLGGVLRNIHETGAFKTLGYDGKRGFDDYVEKTLGIASRKARYLIGIYTKFAMLGVDETKLAEIGWSKAKELARIPDADLKKDFTKLVKKASESTRDDLIGHIKTKYEVVTRGEQVQLKAFSFRLAEAEANTVEEGLKEACTMIGEQDMNKALAHIVGEWRGHSGGSDLDLDSTIELMMAKFGLTSLVFKDAEGNEFEVGGEEQAEGTAETVTA